MGLGRAWGGIAAIGQEGPQRSSLNGNRWRRGKRGAGGCPFRLAVINDEITQDFEKACQIVSGDFRVALGSSCAPCGTRNVTPARRENKLRMRRKFSTNTKLRVTDIASPAVQGRLARSSAVAAERNARPSSTPTFDASCAGQNCSSGVFRFASLSTPTGFVVSITGGWTIRSRIGRRSTPNCSKPRNVAPKITSSLLLENEMSCNTANRRRGPLSLLKAIPNKNFHAELGSPAMPQPWEAKPYLTGYELLPKERIGHCHLQRCGEQARPQIRLGSGRAAASWIGLGNFRLCGVIASTMD